MRDGETGASKGFGFVSFSSFEASDAALAAMNGQFVCNRPIHVSYAYKKDTRGERAFLFLSLPTMIASRRRGAQADTRRRWHEAFFR